jgi:hypothetical protein
MAYVATGFGAALHRASGPIPCRSLNLWVVWGLTTSVNPKQVRNGKIGIAESRYKVLTVGSINKVAWAG